MKSIAVRSMTTSCTSRDGIVDLCLQAVDVRQIDLAAEADDDAPILAVGSHQGAGSVM